MSTPRGRYGADRDPERSGEPPAWGAEPPGGWGRPDPDDGWGPADPDDEWGRPDPAPARSPWGDPDAGTDRTRRGARGRDAYDRDPGYDQDRDREPPYDRDSGYDRDPGFDRGRGYDQDRGYDRQDRDYDRGPGPTYDRDRAYDRDSAYDRGSDGYDRGSDGYDTGSDGYDRGPGYDPGRGQDQDTAIIGGRGAHRDDGSWDDDDFTPGDEPWAPRSVVAPSRRGHGGGPGKRVVGGVVAAVVVVAVVLVLLFWMPGWAVNRTLDRTALQNGVTQVLTQRYGLKVDAVECPDDVVVETGRQFSCQAVVDGEQVPVPGRVTSDAGDYQVSRV